MKRRRRHVMTLAAVYKRRPCAVAVWFALADMAEERKSAVVTPTRDELSQRSGANFKSVSAALTLLESAGWIDRVHVPVKVGGRQTATLLRIALRRRGRSTPRTGARAVEGVQRPKGKGRSTPQDSLTERGGTAAASRKEATAPAAAHAGKAPRAPRVEDEEPKPGEPTISIAELVRQTPGDRAKGGAS
ncbi:hypothetical protein RAS1_37830 [Phycisphaerae bacterium RAS1]|nr:hypothetical protein RAS1_37830 [Phycisphaerae bacterium RAS1]